MCLGSFGTWQAIQIHHPKDVLRAVMESSCSLLGEMTSDKAKKVEAKNTRKQPSTSQHLNMAAAYFSF
jgi:hypothetical protein